MREALLIVNPLASEVSEERVASVRQALQRAASVTTLMTERAGHATELAEAVRPDLAAIFVYSGDGGFNEAVNGADGSVPLGFVPGGATSVLPRALGLPRDPVAAAGRLAEALDRGSTRRLSVGRVNGRRFMFSAGVGLDAAIVRRVDALGRSRGRRPGDLAFTWAAAGVLLDARGRFEPALEVKGLGRAAFALVANGPAYAYVGRRPLRVAPQTRFELGLDVVAPARVRPSTLPRLLRFALLGRGQTTARDILYAHDLDRVEVACDAPMSLQADGEDLGDVEAVLFECERAALPVLI